MSPNEHAILSKFTSVSVQSSDSDYDKLDGILESYCFKRIPITGDGDCCFACISCGLEQFLLDGSYLSLCQLYQFMWHIINQAVVTMML